MPNATEQTEAAIDQDLILQEALARGIIKFSALAQWLQKNRGVQGTPDAIAKAAQRYGTGETSPAFETAWEVLDRAAVHRNEEVCLLYVERKPETYEELSELYNLVDLTNRNTLWVVPSKGMFLVAVSREYKDKVIEALGAKYVTSQVRGLRIISVEPRTGGPLGAEPLAPILTSLRAHDLGVVHAVTGSNEYHLLVREQDSVQAYKAVNQLVRDVAGRGTGADQMSEDSSET